MKSSTSVLSDQAASVQLNMLARATNSAVAELKLAADKVGLSSGGWRRERGRK